MIFRNKICSHIIKKNDKHFDFGESGCEEGVDSIDKCSPPHSLTSRLFKGARKSYISPTKYYTHI